MKNDQSLDDLNNPHLGRSTGTVAGCAPVVSVVQLIKGKWRFLLLGAILGIWGHDGAHAQTVSIAPDCSFFVQYVVSAGVITTVNGLASSNARSPSAGFNAQNTGCVAWTVTYTNSGTTAPLSLRVDSAPDNGSGIPGTWASYATVNCTPGGGTLPCINSGVNPMTATSAAYVAITGYQQWVSVNLTTVTGTGTITVFAYGCRTLTCAGLVTNAAAGGSSTVNVTQVGGLNVPGLNGALGTMLACPNFAILNTSSTGNVQLISASGSTVVYVCDLLWASTGTADVKLTYGTGAACAGGTTDFSGLFKSVINFDHSFQGSLRTPASQGVCFNQSVGNTTGVTVTYGQF